MRALFRLAASWPALFALSSALDFTSPTPSTSIDPSKPLVISWSIGYTDPSVIDFKLSNSKSNSDVVLATGVTTYTGTYTVPPGTFDGSGSGFTLVAVGNGAVLDQVTGLSLGGASGQTSTVTEATVVSTQTVVPVPSGNSGSTVPTAFIDSVGVTTLPGTVSGSQTPASIAHTGSSFVTSTTSRGSISSSAATATAGSTSTASGQRRLAGELVLGAAGVLAGIVALLA